MYFYKVFNKIIITQVYFFIKFLIKSQFNVVLRPNSVLMTKCTDFLYFFFLSFLKIELKQVNNNKFFLFFFFEKLVKHYITLSESERLNKNIYDWSATPRKAELNIFKNDYLIWKKNYAIEFRGHINIRHFWKFLFFASSSISLFLFFSSFTLLCVCFNLQ